MICKACGIDNPADAVKCSHCGTDVQKAAPEVRGKVCPACGFNNPADGKFCARCGIDLKHNRATKGVHGRGPLRQPKRKGKRDPVSRWHPAVIGMVLLGVGVVIVGLLQVARDRYGPPRPTSVIEVKSQDPKLEASVKSIAAKFICSCGSCNEKPLETCACERAIEERQFIRNALQSGQAADQIIAAVSATYGWMKPDSARKPLSGLPALATIPGTAGSNSVPTAHTPSASTMPGKDGIPTLADRNEIFSHFKCPCGQCGMDDLSVCTCKHPRGATEVKAFIDGKIAEGKLTKAQVISEVDRKYGSRKF